MPPPAVPDRIFDAVPAPAPGGGSQAAASRTPTRRRFRTGTLNR